LIRVKPIHRDGFSFIIVRAGKEKYQ